MSEEKKTTEEPKKEIDKELSDLLDSALGDFSKEPEKKTPDKQEDAKTETEEEEVGEDQDWSEEFLRQAAQQFESNLGRLLEETSETTSLTPEQVQQSFQKMAEAAHHVLANPEITDTSSDFSSAISQTLRGLNEGAENLQNPFSETDFLNMFGGAAGAAGGEQNGFLPFMQGMMQSLLSKDVLYPSLKDILEKFPDWLQANESKITPEEKERYQNQQKLMEDVCKELEEETAADSSDVKRQRFEKVLSLMQKLQDYGQPPTDLVGDVGPGLQFDPLGNPEQCCLM